MAKYIVDEKFLNDLGEAVRFLTNTANKMTLEQMAKAIRRAYYENATYCKIEVEDQMALSNILMPTINMNNIYDSILITHDAVSNSELSDKVSLMAIPIPVITMDNIVDNISQTIFIKYYLFNSRDAELYNYSENIQIIDNNFALKNNFIFQGTEETIDEGRMSVVAIDYSNKNIKSVVIDIG